MGVIKNHGGKSFGILVQMYRYGLKQYLWTIDPIWLKFVLSEFGPWMARKKIQPDRVNSSRDITLDHNGTFGPERQQIFVFWSLNEAP